MDVKKVGEYIKKKRKQKNLTQKELAEKLSITDRAISKWERGLCCPDISLLKELSNILDISINELLAGEDLEKFQIKQSEDILLDSVKQYTSVEKKKKQKLLIFTIIILILYFGLIFAMYLTYNQLNKNDNLNWYTYSNKKVLDKFFIAIETYDYKTLTKLAFDAYNTDHVEDTLIEDATKCEEYQKERESGERLVGPGLICKLKYFETIGVKFISHDYLDQNYINGRGEWAIMYDIVAEYKGNKLNYTFSGFVRNGVIAEMNVGLVGNPIFDSDTFDISNKIYSFFYEDSNWE